MKDLIAILLAQTPSIICMSAAALMAYNRIPGVGWFLFVGTILAATRVKVD